MRPTPEQLAEMLAVNSDGSVTWLRPSKYHCALVGKQAGSPTPNRSRKVYWNIQIGGRKHKRSRIVFCLTHGRWPQEQVDHIDGDSLNDRPENLREATASENARNHKGRKKRSSTPMGVKAQDGRFQARIGFDKKQISLGVFATVGEAEEAYRAARRRYFGAFA